MYPQSPSAGRTLAGPESNARAESGHITYTGRPEGWRIRLRRLGLAGVLIAVLGLGTGACSGTASPAASGTASPVAGLPATGGSKLLSKIAAYLRGASPQERLAFAQCMRTNGFPNFPSTLSLEALQAADIDVRSANVRSSLRSAAKACESKLLG